MSFSSRWLLCTGCTVCRGRRDAHDCRAAGGRATQEQLPRSGDVQDVRYAAGAGMRTTAGPQEVEQRRSSCRGAAISRLVGLAPKPRVNLIRFHGVFANVTTVVIPAAFRWTGLALVASGIIVAVITPMWRQFSEELLTGYAITSIPEKIIPYWPLSHSFRFLLLQWAASSQAGQSAISPRRWGWINVLLEFCPKDGSYWEKK